MPLTLEDIDARVRKLEAVQELILRILATTRPLAKILEHYGATETQERAFYALLDDVTARARGREEDRPTFAYFIMKVQEIFPALRHDREFVNVLVDTLRMSRPAYRELATYAEANGWPAWT